MCICVAYIKEVKSLPNIASAKKRVRQTEARTAHNKVYKNKIKHSIKKFNEICASGDVEKTKSALKDAVKLIDKAAAKGVIHKNTAARRKSKLYKKLADIEVSAS